MWKKEKNLKFEVPSPAGLCSLSPPCHPKQDGQKTGKERSERTLAGCSWVCVCLHSTHLSWWHHLSCSLSAFCVVGSQKMNGTHDEILHSGNCNCTNCSTTLFEKLIPLPHTFWCDSSTAIKIKIKLNKDKDKAK